MATLYQTVSSCLQKKSGAAPVATDNLDTIDLDTPTDPDDVKENDAPELDSDKKTDEIIEPQKPVGLMWRMSSGLYNTTSGAITGAVGMGVGSVKWVAGKSYNAGSAVVSTTISTTKTVASKVPVPIPKWKAKAKSE